MLNDYLKKTCLDGGNNFFGKIFTREILEFCKRKDIGNGERLKVS